MKKNFSVICIILLLAMLLVGCSGKKNTASMGAVPNELQEAEATATPVPVSTDSVMDDTIVVKSTAGIKIGFSLSYQQSDHATLSAAGFQEYCDAAGVAYEIRDANGDAKKQAEDIQYFTQQGFSAIAVAPAGETVAEACKQAQAAGIPLITVTAIKGVNADILVDPGDYNMAYRASGRMVNLVGNRSGIAILSPEKPDWRVAQRIEAFDLMITETAIPVLAREKSSSVTTAESLAAKLIADFPDLGGIWCADSASLEGAAKAVKAANATIPVGGAEITPEILTFMQEGWVQVAATQLPKGQGALVAEAAAGLALGEYYPPIIESPFRVYNQESYEIARLEIQGLEVPEELE